MRHSVIWTVFSALFALFLLAGMPGAVLIISCAYWENPLKVARDYLEMVAEVYSR